MSVKIANNTEIKEKKKEEASFHLITFNDEISKFGTKLMAKMIFVVKEERKKNIQKDIYHVMSEKKTKGKNNKESFSSILIRSRDTKIDKDR